MLVTLALGLAAGLAAAADFQIRRSLSGLREANGAPAFTSSPVASVETGEPYLYSITTSDPNAGQTRTISLADAPPWLTLGAVDSNAGTATLSGTAGDPGSYQVWLVVTDNGDPVRNSAQVFTLNVLLINQAPSFSSSPVTSVNENSAYSYAVTTGDPDAGQTRTVALVSGPSWLGLSAVDSVNGTATLSGTAQRPEVAHVVLSVTDGGTSDPITVQQAFDVTVADLPCAPGSNPQIFSSTTTSSVTFPAGCTRATVSAWGGGGGAGGTNNVGAGNTSGHGGAGGYAKGDVDLLGLVSLNYIVGGGGNRCGGSGGSSGGLSGIFAGSASQANAILIAGGGGGGGRGIDTGGNLGGAAGAGGGSSGASGAGGGLGGPGLGGSQTAAGSSNVAGSGMTGGAGRRGNLAADCSKPSHGFANTGGGHGGGGGGGGYWGGGGGNGSGERGAGGGGGSGYVGNARVSNSQLVASSGRVMATAGTTDTNYGGGAGAGGERVAGSNGTAGRLAIIWAE